MSKYLSFSIVLVAFTLAVSCSNSGKSAKTKDAEKVEVVLKRTMKGLIENLESIK